ncbi:MAG: methionine biosynthesis protein MetW, partial [Porticoccaceae bacterium]
MNQDFDFIRDWIAPNTKVLDLGCGDGALLHSLQQQRHVLGYGLEVDSEAIDQCIAKGVNVIEQDLNKGLTNFADGSFDTVVMT